MNAELIAKLQKVLAMTSSPVEAEAATAAEILNRLLIKHNLSMADLERRGQQAPKVMEDRTDLGKAAFKWKLDLARAIATHYFCYPIIGWDKTVTFIGRPDNVESLKMLYGWIIDQIKRISADARREHEQNTGEHIDPLRWQVNFGVGIVGRLGQRLEELKRKQASDVNTYAIVQHHATEISDWLEAKGEGRIDGRLTKEQQEREDRYRAEEKLKHDDPEAYYAKYPWERPLSAEDQKKEEERTRKDNERYWKRQERNARRRTGRAYRPMSPEQLRHADEAERASFEGRKNASKVNLQPFVSDNKKNKEVA